MQKNKKFIIIFLSAVFCLLAIFLLTYFAWAQNNKESTAPNTFIGNTDISNMNRFEIERVLKEKVVDIRNLGINFSYNGKTENLHLGLQAASPDIPEPDLKYAESFIFDDDATFNNIFSKKNNSFTNYLKNKFFNNSTQIDFIFHYSEEILNEWLQNSFPSANIEPENAYFSLDPNNIKIMVNNQEKVGKEINQDYLEEDLKNQLSKLFAPEITIKTKSKYPDINQGELEKLRPEAERILEKEEFVTYFLEKFNQKEEKITFSIKEGDLVTWISASKNRGNLELKLDRKKIENYLYKNVSPSINQDVVLPRFDIKDNKVISWQTGKNGREVNIEKSLENILSAINLNIWEAEIEVKDINVDDFNDGNQFQIKEIIGTGHSNFADSPSNRRHNIKVGSDSIHGLLIKPGDEFSLIENLGEIDAENGYLPELVIKGNKTIPEYGGGLCQVATTVFRSALGSGLPITARRSHSYRVSYYEPAGTDASVYDPWPDIKFLNDTNNYILIQSRIEGNNLYYDFWGTEDGRVSTTTKPVVYNITPPPPTKIIETDELEPGKRRCTESAHNGADAYFDYIVTYPEGATTTPLQEIRFSSHYIPWQEVCLVGKENAPEEELLNTDTVEETINSDIISEDNKINPEP